MFKNVGRELKNWAKFLVIVFTIPWGIVALSFLFMGIAEEEWALVLLAVLLGPIIVVIGYFFARLTGIMLYAFGELVENTKIMKDALTVNSMKENSEIMDYIVKLKSSLDSCSSQLMLKAKSLDVELERIKAKQLELMSGKIDIEGDL